MTFEYPSPTIESPQAQKRRHKYVVALLAVVFSMLLLPATTQADNDYKYYPYKYKNHKNKNRHSSVRFRDVSKRVRGFTHTNNGGTRVGDNVSGVAWLDCDNDRDLDLFIANGIGADDGLMINNGRGGFRNSTGAGAGDIGDSNGSSGVAAADLNNDGYTDLVVMGDPAFLKGVHSARPIRVYRNDGDCHFTEVTDDGFDSIAAIPGTVLHVSLGDIDNDGLLDMFLVAPSSLTTQFIPSNTMFRNRGNFDFEDISAGAGDAIYGLGACDSAFTHYDDDGYIDLLIGDCNFKQDRQTYRDFLEAAGLPPEAFPPFASTGGRLLRNNGDNSFTRLDVDLPQPPAPKDQLFPPLENGFWMASTVGDIDNDGDYDVLLTNVGEFFSFIDPIFAQEPFLGERLPNGKYKDITKSSGVQDIAVKFAWGTNFADFDNDSWEDIVMAGNLPELGNQFGNPGYLWLNNRDKTFRHVGQPVDLALRYSSGVAVADYDNDGRVDIAISNARVDVPVVIPDVVNIQPADDTLTLLRNTTRNRNSWITLRLVGKHSNRSAIGAQVKVKANRTRMLKEVRAGENFLSTSSPWQTFGLGRTYKRWQKVKVKWPSGRIERFWVRTGRTSTIREGYGKRRRRF